MTDKTQELDRYIEQHLPTYIQEMTRLCNQPSVSPQSLGMRECAALVAELLQSRGIIAQVQETGGHPVVIGDYGDGPATLLFYNHYDVQPPEPFDLWESPPFEATLRDGKLFARGTADDKGEIISRLAAFDAVRAVYGEPPCRIKFLVEGEEEIGSPHLNAFINDQRERLATDVCIWENGEVGYDGRLVMYLGLRGIVAVTLRVRTIANDAHSGMYSYLPNAAWRLVWALSTLKDQRERILIPGFYDDVRPPTARQRELLAAMPSKDEEDKAFYEITHFAGNLSGQALKESVYLPTCTINGLTSGYQGEGGKAIIPAEASCKLDFRLAPGQEPQRVVRQLRAHLDVQGFDDIEVTIDSGCEKAGIVDPDDPYVQLAVETAREVYGKEPVICPLDGGSGPYATFLEHLHAPIVISGVSYLGCLAHSPNEHIRIADWLLGTKHMAHMLARVGQR